MAPVFVIPPLGILLAQFVTLSIMSTAFRPMLLFDAQRARFGLYYVVKLLRTSRPNSEIMLSNVLFTDES